MRKLHKIVYQLIKDENILVFESENQAMVENEYEQSKDCDESLDLVEFYEEVFEDGNGDEYSIFADRKMNGIYLVSLFFDNVWSTP